MKSLIRELDATNTAVYEGKAIPSTEELSKLVLDQLIKGNTTLISIFEAAPLALIALAGQEHLQRQIFVNAFYDRNWMKIAYFDCIFSEILAMIRLLDFPLHNNVDIACSQEELLDVAKSISFFDASHPLEAYSDCIDYLFVSFANATQRGRIQFSVAVELIRYGSHANFCAGYVQFVSELLNNTRNSEIIYKSVASIIIDGIETFTSLHADLLAAILNPGVIMELQDRMAEVLKLCYELFADSRIDECVEIVRRIDPRFVDERLMTRLGAPNITELQASLAACAFRFIKEMLSREMTAPDSWFASHEIKGITVILNYFAAISQEEQFTVGTEPIYIAVCQLFCMIRESPALMELFPQALQRFNFEVPWILDYAGEPTDCELRLGLYSIPKWEVIQQYEAHDMQETGLEPVEKVPAAESKIDEPQEEEQLEQDASQQIVASIPILESEPQDIIGDDVFGEDTKCDLDLKFV